MNRFKHKILNVIRVAGYLTISLVLLYILVYLNESAIIKQTFSEYLANATFTDRFYLGQVQNIRISKWPNGDIDQNILDELNSRFARKRLVLKKASEAIFIKDSSENKLKNFFSMGYYDKTSKERGSILSVGPVHWISPIKVSVGISWYYGSLSSYSATAIMVFNGRQWVTKEYVNVSLS
jgi:hypothetical protein